MAIIRGLLFSLQPFSSNSSLLAALVVFLTLLIHPLKDGCLYHVHLFNEYPLTHPLKICVRVSQGYIKDNERWEELIQITKPHNLEECKQGLIVYINTRPM